MHRSKSVESNESGSKIDPERVSFWITNQSDLYLAIMVNHRKVNLFETKPLKSVTSMNTSQFLDKQIMDLSPSKSADLNNNNDFMDLMNPQSEEEADNVGSSSFKKKDEILPNYDFQPIHRPPVAVQSDPPSATRAWNSIDSKPNSSTLRSYNSIEHVEPDRIIPEKAERASDSAMLSEIDGTMKRYIDSVLHAIDGVSARLSQLESRTRYLEDSVDELKASIGNNYGSADGKMRQLENILLEVQTGVHDLKDKQEVMDGQMQLAKLQISKPEKSSELSNAMHPDSMQQTAASAPPHQPGLQQFSIPVPQQVPSLPPNAPPPSQHNIYPPPGPTPPGPQRDAYFTQSGQTQDAQSQHYQMPPPAQHQQQPLAPAHEAQSQQYQMPPPAQHQQQPLNPAHEAQSQQYQMPPPAQHQQQPLSPPPPPQQYQSSSVPPYPQPPPPQQPHPSIVGANPPHIPPPLGHRTEEGPYMPPQSYPPNIHQPPSQPNSTPPHSQQYYVSPPSMYEQPAAGGRSSSGFPSAYGPPSRPSEPYTYGGPASQYNSGSSIKAQPHSPVGSNSNYSQLPTARILPPAVPTAAGNSGGSSSGGSGNKVPIDDVVEKVTNMGFPKDVVRATVRRLTENGQSVDLNIVLDKLMNDGDAQSQRGWFGR